MTHRFRLTIFTLLAAALSAAPGTAQAPAAAPVPGVSSTAEAPAGTEASRVARRSILPDGSVLIEYEDGTSRQLPGPSGAPPSSAGEAAPDEAGVVPAAPPEWLKDEATNTAFLEAMQAYYAYRVAGLQHRSRVFQWQLFSSRVIFAVVLVLVGAGIIFAALQFRAGLRPGGGGSGVTEIDLSATSVKVSSPVLGVIILVISLAFFYLYLVYVYPITEIV
jgi:hypothetical protein